MGKTCFLFGAGAESSFDICNGAEFAKQLLGRNREDDMHTAIKEYFVERHGRVNNDWYPAYNPHSFKEGALFKKSIRKIKCEGVIGDEVLDGLEELVAALNDDSPAFENKAVDKEYLRKTDEITMTDKGWELVTKYPNYMGILDERFHTIINPKALGPNKFWGVIQFYTKAYLIMVKGILGEKSPTYKEILSDPGVIHGQIRDAIKTDPRFERESYYSILCEKLDSSGNRENDDICILTTNYTPIIDHILKYSMAEKTAYVHGKLSWFESPYQLQVFDIDEPCFSENYKSDILFPYLFVQSGVKPIIEKRQLMEYAKALDFLERVDTVIIVGYRINNDDNHLNSLLHSFLLSKKNIKYFAFNDKKCTPECIFEKLRIPSWKREDSGKIEVIHINKDNGHNVFSKEIKTL